MLDIGYEATSGVSRCFFVTEILSVRGFFVIALLQDYDLSVTLQLDGQ
jgi:hypothetical protein